MVPLAFLGPARPRRHACTEHKHGVPACRTVLFGQFQVLEGVTVGRDPWCEGADPWLPQMAWFRVQFLTVIEDNCTESTTERINYGTTRPQDAARCPSG